jgi:hypothetical protein
MTNARTPRRRRIAVVVTVAAALAMTATPRAQFVVFDPTSFEEAIRQGVQLEQQYVQLIRSYQFMVQQARRLPGNLAARYRNLATPWLNLVAEDTFGVNRGWLTTANTGNAALAGYRAATETLQAYAAVIDQIPVDQVPRVKTAYAALELRDGLNVHALEMLGLLRSHSTDVELALRRLEDDTFSGDDAFHTQVAVLDKINAATVSSARMTKDTNQILIALLEAQLAEGRRQRESEAIALNAHIAFHRDTRDLLRRSIVGTTEALTNFRLP